MSLSTIEQLKKILDNYDVGGFKIGEKRIRSLLRNHILYAYEAKIFSKKSRRYTFYHACRKILFMLLSFWHLPKLWRCEYLFLSSLNEERKMNGVYANRLFASLVDICGPRQCLVLSHYNPKKAIRRQRQCDTMSIDIINMFTLFVKIGTTHITNEDQLNALLQELGIGHFNHRYYINTLLKLGKVYKRILSRSRIKAIFVVCAYSSNQAVIAPAKQLGIPVVEIQHGVVSKDHFAYYYPNNDIVDREDLPDFFWGRGSETNKVFSEDNQFLDPSHVATIGHDYLNYLSAQSIDQPQGREQYRYSICISGQDQIEERLFAFLDEVIPAVSDVLFVYIPRSLTSQRSRAKQYPNVLIPSDIQIYTYMQLCDFHLTISSSTCLEALAFNKKNIMLNIDNLARRYYSELLGAQTSYYVENPTELISLLHSLEPNYDIQPVQVEAQKYFANVTLEEKKKLLTQLVLR